MSLGELPRITLLGQAICIGNKRSRKCQRHMLVLYIYQQCAQHYGVGFAL